MVFKVLDDDQMGTDFVSDVECHVFCLAENPIIGPILDKSCKSLPGIVHEASDYCRRKLCRTLDRACFF